MVDYKAALVNAGAFAVGAASSIAGVFILPQEFGNLERLIMVASIVGVYSVGHAKGQRFAERVFRSERENLQKTLAGKQAALDNERRKNAELAKRWEDLQAGERRKREIFDSLSSRDKWCLAQVVSRYPSKFSMSGNLFDGNFYTLAEEAGILRFCGEEDWGSETRKVYTIALEWRGWISEHADELPDPTSKAPS